MENQHRKIKGYRELNQDEIDLMNEIKEAGQALGDLCKKIETIHFGSEDSIDVEWLMEGKKNLQVGIMLLVRSVARPDSF